jgi:hypothetical protein
MTILNGRWVDNNFNPIDEMNYCQLKELGRKVQSLYGENISYNRIEFVNNLSSLNEQQEEALRTVFDSNLIDKLV